jgi:hypothetical protein
MFRDRLRVTGGESNADFTVTYLTPEGKDITKAVVAGRFVTPLLAANKGYVVTVRVTATRSAGIGDVILRDLRAASVLHPARIDTVRYVVTVRR